MKYLTLNYDPSINKEKIFEYNPPPALVVDSKTNELLKKLPTPHKIDAIVLTSYINKKSTYAQKNELIQSLKLIQYRLSNGFNKELGNLSNSEKNIILGKLSEGLDGCPQGLHNRVQEIILSWNQPENIFQLLHQVRESLVAKAAAKATSNVHATNRFFTLAQACGLGVRARVASDKYLGDLDDHSILKRLNEVFERELTLVRIVQMVAANLHTALGHCYHGYDAKGYVQGDYDAILSRLNQLLAVPPDNLDLKVGDCFLVEEKEENGIPFQRCVDIHWNYIKQVIFKQLKHYGVFAEVPFEPTNLNDFLLYLETYPTVLENIPDLLYYAKKFISNAENFNTFLKNLNDIQRAAVFEDCTDFLLSMIQGKQDFIQIIQYLSDEQVTHLCQKWGALRIFIQKLDHFQLVFPLLNARQTSALWDAIGTYLLCNIHTGKDFNALIKPIDAKYRTMIFNRCTPFLTQFIHSAYDFNQVFEHLKNQEGTTAVKKYIPFLSELIKSAKDFNQVFQYLNRELRKEIFESYHSLLPKLIQNIDDFVQISMYSNHDQRAIAFNVICKRLPSIINNASAFAALMEELNEEQSAIVWKACTPKHFLKIIQNPYDFNRKVFPYTSRSRSDSLCDLLMRQSWDFINSARDFNEMMYFSDDKQREKIFKAYQFSLASMIKDSNDLAQVIQYLNDGQRKKVFVACSDRCFQLLKAPSDYEAVFKRFNDGIQLREMAPFFSTMSEKDPSFLENIIPSLNRQELNFFEYVRNLLPIVKNVSELGSILSILNKHQIKIICEDYAIFFHEMIQKGSDVSALFNRLNINQIAVISSAFPSLLDQLVNTDNTLNEILLNLNDPKKITLIGSAFKQWLCSVITKPNHLHTALKDLPPHHKKVAFAVLIRYVLAEVKHLSDFKAMLLDLEDEQRKIISGQFVPCLRTMVKGALDFNDFIQCFKQEERENVYQANFEFITNFTKNMHDLKDVLLHLGEEKLRSIFSRDYLALPLLIPVIKNACDLYSAMPFISLISFKGKVALLDGLQREEWFESWVAKKLVGRNAFQSFFNDITPEDVIKQPPHDSYYSTFQRSLAAYALLKEQEKKSSTETGSHYSKPMWNYLKGLAKAFFNQEDIEKMHRRRPKTIQSFFASKATPTQLYPGDLTIGAIPRNQ